MIEAWLPNLGYADTSKRERLLECPFMDFLEQDKGIAFAFHEDSPTEQGKLFSLAMFYMINHQMALYYYNGSLNDGVDAEIHQWNHWVEYDVGQPVINNLGFADFLDSGSNRFFVFQSGSNPEYQVLGRQFLRSDNQRVLVLAKLMGPGQTAGSNSAVVPLNGSYKQVQSDLTLGPTVNSIYLSNNEGVILVKQSGSGCRDCPDPTQ